MDYTEQIPSTTHPSTCRLPQRMLIIHQIRHPMGIQQRPYQRRQRMESSIPYEPRPIRTNGNVLRTNKLTSDLPNNDELNIRPRNCRSMAHHLHGQHGNTHSENSKQNGSNTHTMTSTTCQQSPRKTTKT